MSKTEVTVTIRGQEFQILTDEDEGSLLTVARYLDETMTSVEQRTGTVDSLDVALLTALNLSREILDLRAAGGGPGLAPERLRALVDLAEAAAEAPGS